jgi:hypothetical protein
VAVQQVSGCGLSEAMQACLPRVFAGVVPQVVVYVLLLQSVQCASCCLPHLRVQLHVPWHAYLWCILGSPQAPDS